MALRAARRNSPTHILGVGLVGCIVALAFAGPTGAQQNPAPGAAARAPTAKNSDAGSPGGDIETKKVQLRGVQENLSASDEQRRKIQADIEEIRTDRVRLTAALIDASDKVHAAESKVAEVEKRLDTLTGSEDAIKRSLERRRGVIAEVLGALQRMGRKPLPAILVRPEDMLLAIRTSMLLSTVVPELRSETEALASDLSELTRVRSAIVADRDTLSQETVNLGAEQARLSALIEARQAAQTQAEGELAAEQQHAADLARQATSLRELIGRMEMDVSLAKRAADAAHAADDAQRKAAESDAEGVRARVATGAFKDPARLAPATSFVDAKGLLPFPASGTILKGFGTDDGFGSSEHGISLATRPRAVVSSPSDGWISFSGPYRTYGQLLIINTGGGYYIVLAGMDHTNVALGQFVLAGEPVGTMGDGSVKTAAAIALGAAQPILYVEFRKDGAAIDPSPWWAKAELEKVRG